MARNNNLTGRQEVDAKWRRRIDNRLKDAPKVLTEFARNYELSPRSMYYYVGIIKDFLSVVDKPLDEIKMLDISNHINSIGDGDTKQQQRTVVFSALKTFFKWLTMVEYIPKFPMIGMKKPSVDKEEDAYRNDVLTPEEVKLFLMNVHSGVGTDKAIAFQKRMRNRDIAIMYLLIQTGIRVSPASELNISDVDFENGIISVRGKGKKPQEIEVPEQLLEKINIWLNDRRKIKNNTDALFISEKGTRLDKNSIGYLVKKFSEGINKKVSPHKFRATFATLLDELNYPMEDIRLLMGHANISTTRIYIRNKKNKSREAANSLSKMLNM